MKLSERDLARRRFLRFLAASPLAALGGPASAQTPVGEPLIARAADALNVFELEAVARQVVPPAHFGYLATGVLDDATFNANRAGFSRWGVKTRRLSGIARPDLSIRLFGETWGSPVALAPVSSQRAFHPEGERAVARAARTRSALQILSTLTTSPIEDVVADRGGPIWFQLYPTNQPDATRALVRRADAAGASAIVLTIDLLAGGGRRETMARLARTDTRDCAVCHDDAPGSGRSFFNRKSMFADIDLATITSPNNPLLTWDDVGRLRDLTRKRLMVKGVMTGEDADLAVRQGVDGIIVSNHGGRAEESLMGAIDVLPEVVAAVGGRAPVLIDGGFRRGPDIFKALALGASAVCIGRPYVWGLGAFGETGVETAMRLIDQELAQCMMQAGTAKLADISRASVTSIG
ncbi:MAG: alpha-hydroxy acid oxidase [Alphaproteobacteria bacterium]|nr:alpha-hydroxy acid oxidase [Alphaproteobacteria bacterium]